MRLPALFLWLLFQPLAKEARADGAPSVCPDCNIILISVDTLRPDHLGCYGYPRNTSPNIDRLARRGLVFDDFIVQAYLTPVSMASIFTSQYPSVNGYTSFSGVLESSAVVLPEVLRTYGFKTAAFLTSPEFYMASPAKADVPIKPLLTFQRGFETYSFPREEIALKDVKRDVPENNVFQWLEANHRSKFFLWLALGSAHFPYGFSAPERIRRRFLPKEHHGVLANVPPGHLGWWYPLSRIYQGWIYPLPGTDWPDPNLFRNGQPVRLTPQDAEAIIGSYDAGVYYTDAFIGKLWAAAKRLRLDKNTIFVITSEHAEDLGEHGYYSHYDLYNTELRAPLIIVHPKLAKNPGRIRALASGLDLSPTLLDMVGIPSFHQAQGRSLMGVISGAERGEETLAFSERMPPWEVVLYQFMLFRVPKELYDWRGRYAALLKRSIGEGWDSSTADTAVQDRRWKLLHRRSLDFLRQASWWTYLTGKPPPVSPYELYDLDSDPNEAHDVLARYPQEADRLQSKLTAFEKELDRRRKEKRMSMRPKQLIPYP